MDMLTSTNEVIKMTAGVHRRAGGSFCSQNRFEEQVTNMLSIFQIHLSSIEDILGRPVRRAIAMQIPNEGEAQELIDVLLGLNETNLCYPFRLTNTISISDQRELQKQQDGKNKTVEWPSTLIYCQSPTVEYVRNQIGSKNYFVKESDFNDIVITKNQLWSLLIKEKIVIEEKVISKEIINIEKIDDTKNIIQRLPNELTDYKTVLIDWLEENNGNEFSTAIISLDLKSKLLTTEKFLRNEGLLLQVEQHFGRLSEKFDHHQEEKNNASGQDLIETLPETLKKYNHLLNAWFMVEKTQIEDRDYVSRESLPCQKEITVGIRQLWDHLLEQGVIEDRVVVFSDNDGKDDESVQHRVEQIEKELQSINKIEEICFKYHELETLKEITFSDAVSYVTSNKLDSCLNILFPGRLFELKEKINRHKRKEQLDSYRAQLAQILFSSIGQLKTIPSISAAIRPVTECLPINSGRSYPTDEIRDFEIQLFDQVILLKAAKKPWRWDWRAFAVAMIGAAQIVAGVALNVVTVGVASPIANALIAEGVSDMIFAIQQGIAGTFTWKGYASHKIWSVCLTVATAGIGAYLTRGAMAGRAALYGFKGKAGLSLLLAAGKKVLAKCGQAVLSAMSALGVDKFFSWLKKFIIENILSHIKGLIRRIFSNRFETLAKTLDSIWKQMKDSGHNLAETIKHIDDSISKASQSELCTVWINQIANKASSVGNAMCKSFGEASSVIDAQGTHFENKGKHQLFELEQTEGLNNLKGAHTTFNFAAKIASYTAKATKVISVLKNGAEIVNLVGYAPGYVDNIERGLTKEITKLEDLHSENSQQQNSTSQSDNVQFQKYKNEVSQRVEQDIVKHMLDSVTSAWLQPCLQSKVESIAVSIGKNAIDKIGKMFERNDGQLSLASLTNGAQSKTQLKDNAEITAAKKRLQEQVGDNVCHQERDQNGNPVIMANTFEKLIENMGNRKAGLLEMQIVADALGIPLKILDTVGDYTKGSNKNSFTYNPNEGETKDEIQLVYTKNEDGSSHVEPADQNVKPIELAAGDGQNNRCFYVAIAASQGCTVEDLLSKVKDHALNNKLARYLFDQKVDEALPVLRVGQRPSNPGKNKAIISTYDEIKNGKRYSRTFKSTIGFENLKEGSEVLKAARDDMKRDNPAEDNVPTKMFDTAHLLAALLGGSGNDPNNLIPMHKNLNRGEFKNIERDIFNFIQQNKELKVNVEIMACYDPLGKFPIEFEYNWNSEDGKTDFKSGKMSNKDCLKAEERLRNPEPVESAWNRGMRCRGDFFSKGIPMNKPKNAAETDRLLHSKIAKKTASYQDRENPKKLNSKQRVKWLADDSARTKRAKK